LNAKLLSLGNEKKKQAFLLHFARFFVILRFFEREITLFRQKKETSFFVLLSTFRNFGFAEISVTRE